MDIPSYNLPCITLILMTLILLAWMTYVDGAHTNGPRTDNTVCKVSTIVAQDN